MTNTSQLGVARLDGRYVLSLGLATAAASAAGLSFGVARRLDGGNLAYWQSGAAVAALVATIFTVDAMRKWLRARRPRQAVRGMPRTSGALPAPPALLALPAPAKTVQAKPREEDMPSASKANAAQADEPTGKVESERARLRADGFTDPEISQILIAREAGGGKAAFGSGIATGLLNNVDAVVTHVRSLVPGFKTDLAHILNRDADSATRIGGALSLTVKTAAIMVVGYFVYLEALQFRAAAYKTWAEACIQRQQNQINFSTTNDLLSGRMNSLDADCKTQ